MMQYIKTFQTILILTLLTFANLGFAKNNENNKSYEVKSISISNSIFFAGEEVPVERFDIYERLDREILSNTYFHSNTILMVKRANRYFPIIEPILQKNGIPEDFKYIAMIESGFDPRAKSPAGAAGIWQFLKATGKQYGMEVNNYVDERYNVEIATEAACKYLNHAYEKFGSWTLVAASYNYGIRGVQTAQQKQLQKNYFDLLLPSETMRYVFRAIAMKQILKDPQQYGFYIHKNDLYTPLAYKEKVVNYPIKNIAQFAKQNKTSYYLLKEYNPWLRDNYLINRSKKKYTFKIPSMDKLQRPNSVKPYSKNWVVDEK